MWEYQEFVAKAQLYFSRAEQHPRVLEDDSSTLWLLLGLEFLMRAPLAKIHPTLLADPNGDSIMHAAGFGSPEGGALKSVPAHTVIKRLGMIIPGFNKEIREYATQLTGMRNEELHTSSSALAVDVTAWFPQFTRVVEVLCEHLELDADDVVGAEIMRHGRSLTGESDKRLEQEIRRRINEAKSFYAKLKPEEISARRAKVIGLSRDGIFSSLALPKDVRDSISSMPKLPQDLSQSQSQVLVVDCPACGENAILGMTPVRRTNERIEDDEILHDVVYIAESLSCMVCDLRLESIAELRVAQIQLQYVDTIYETLAERYDVYDFEPDYGND